MSTVARLGDLLHRSFFGPAWHGPAVMELVPAIPATGAAAPPAAGSHSIWQLVLHMIAWKEEVCRRLSGPGRKLSGDEDWPPVADTSQVAWQSAVDRLVASQRALESAVSALSDEKLVAPLADLPGGLEELIHAIIHHDLYHAGQIAILKQAQQDRR